MGKMQKTVKLAGVRYTITTHVDSDAMMFRWAAFSEKDTDDEWTVAMGFADSFDAALDSARAQVEAYVDGLGRVQRMLSK